MFYRTATSNVRQLYFMYRKQRVSSDLARNGSTSVSLPPPIPFFLIYFFKLIPFVRCICLLVLSVNISATVNINASYFERQSSSPSQIQFVWYRTVSHTANNTYIPSPSRSLFLSRPITHPLYPTLSPDITYINGERNEARSSSLLKNYCVLLPRKQYIHTCIVR